MVTISEDENQTLELDGEATLNFARELHVELSAAVKKVTGPIIIQAERLEALDVIGAQILLALRQSLVPGRVRFVGWSVPITEFLRASGLMPHFL